MLGMLNSFISACYKMLEREKSYEIGNRFPINLEGPPR